MKKDNRNHKIQATDRSGKSVYILIASSLRQLSMVILNFVSRTVFIHILGADYLGLNGLFSNILSLLSLTELGIGTAISFYFYKPLAEHDIEQIKSLSHFYKNCYAAIGTIMTVIGLALLPALPYLVNFDQDLPVNLYLVYILYLFNSSASYLFFAYKQGIIAADQKQYIVEKINIAFTFISCLTDIIVLITFRNYIFYLLFKLIITIVKNITIALRVDKEYPYLNDKHYSKISAEDKKTIFKNVGNAAIFKIGSTLFNSTDNIMISVLLGTVLVGYYSNYYLIISQISVVINIAVQSLAAGVGNVMAKENEEKQYAIFKELNFYLMLLTSFCVICLFQLINPFIYIWIGHNNQNYVLSQMTVLFLCWSLYYDGTTQVMNTFREASGNFLIGRTLQLYGGIANIVLDYIFVNCQVKMYKSS